jgi:hypothetical protein
MLYRLLRLPNNARSATFASYLDVKHIADLNDVLVPATIYCGNSRSPSRDLTWRSLVNSMIVRASRLQESMSDYVVYH